MAIFRPSRLTVLFLLFLTALSARADGDAPLMTLDRAGDFSIGLYSQWLEDPGNQLQLADVLTSPDWQTSTQDGLNFGFSNSAYWLKTRVQVSYPERWALWLRYSLLDYVDLYFCPADVTDPAACSHQQAGDEITFADGRDIEHPNLILQTPLQAGGEYLLLMRVKTRGTYQIPASLVDSATLQHELLRNNIIRGGYYATMLVMGLYNLFIFFSTRVRSYLYYSAVTLTFLLFHMTYEGSAFQFFWPQNPDINHYALPLAFGINLIFLSLFVPNFLQLKKYSHTMYRLFRVYTAISVMSLVMMLLIPYQVIVPINNVLSIVMLLTALVVSILFWVRGHSGARYFTIAWAALITGLVLANARSLGWIPTNTFTLYAYQLGSFMEIILLSLALGERIVKLQNDQLEARKAMVKSQEDAIQYLRDYEDLYQNSLTGKFQLDDDGYFIKSNPAWRSMLGYGEQASFAADNPTFNSLLADPLEQRRLWRRLHKDGRVQGYVVAISQPLTGERLMVSITMRKRAHDERAAWIGSGQNVTDEYHKEQALIHLQKEKTQALRQLVMGIAHEMNTPLGNIRMAESYLSDEHEDWNTEELQAHLKEGLEHIHDGIGRLNNLNQLMKNAIVQENQYAEESLKIRPWLEQWQLEIQMLHPGVVIRAIVHSYLTEWRTYPEALSIILTQLADNSCKHNPEKLAAGELEIQVELRERGDTLELLYRDNGKGIDDEQRDVIFMPFYTTQRKLAENKGLGLYQTYNLLTELLHGQIEWPPGDHGFALTVRFVLPPQEEKEDDNTDDVIAEADITDDE
ncbi:MAG: sensor histidine kinase [Pseudomonadota bacterium]|nr:sensor histidine kinase [Pseudomonadota bacterium]